MGDARAENARSAIRLRITCLSLQLEKGCLTPSLRKEMSHVIKLHSEALERPDLITDRNVAKALDLLNDCIEDHWSRVYRSYTDHSYLLGDIGQYQIFLTAILLAEYTGVPYSSHDLGDWLGHRAGIVEQHRAGVGDKTVESTYQDGIVFPLEELALDLYHVEDRICLAAADEKQLQPLGRHIRRLVGQCDWQKLAGTLLKDRELARDLFVFQPLLPGCFDDNVRARVLQGIERIEHKYFTDLAGPVKFTVSKHAMNLSARRASEGGSRGFSLGAGARGVLDACCSSEGPR